jgi:hypothetical protein
MMVKGLEKPGPVGAKIPFRHARMFSPLLAPSTSTTPLLTRELVEKPFFERFLVDKSRASPRFLPLFDPKVIISGAIFY